MVWIKQTRYFAVYGHNKFNRGHISTNGINEETDRTTQSFTLMGGGLFHLAFGAILTGSAIGSNK